ncbi:hypothetical protein PGT21_007869 [Puccinia graminis f. sp. tritici]|uniref:Uncharacterized protein n=1 Tax=Puccinia graminis f. sp. tritici TaxID=56615 RepID=A0A5B0P531_PUCGR|nr:hypothetical protein PGT21_007869 [Puccinia graminis f. sp. tritici]KAA1099069.1 hypothetical protein PGTUg99_012881 [Puccinia graminis f. sp. tritici]
MRCALLFFWAVASCLALQNQLDHRRSLSPRQVVESDTTVISEHIVTSFTQVTDTYTTIQTYFEETYKTLYTQTTIQEAGATLTQFQQRLEESVTVIGGGCNCDVAGVKTEIIESSVTVWFTRLQYMVQICRQRFYSQYTTYFGTTFTRISEHLQVALAVTYNTGINIDHIVTHVFQTARIDSTVLSSVNIKTTSFTRISETVTKRQGVFARIPPPTGPREPKRLQAVLRAAHNSSSPVDASHKTGATRDGRHNSTLPVDSVHRPSVNGSTPPVDSVHRPSVNGSRTPWDSDRKSRPTTPTTPGGSNAGTGLNSTVPGAGHHSTPPSGGYKPEPPTASDHLPNQSNRVGMPPSPGTTGNQPYVNNPNHGKVGETPSPYGHQTGNSPYGHPTGNSGFGQGAAPGTTGTSPFSPYRQPGTGPYATPNNNAGMNHAGASNEMTNAPYGHAGSAGNKPSYGNPVGAPAYGGAGQSQWNAPKPPSNFGNTGNGFSSPPSATHGANGGSGTQEHGSGFGAPNTGPGFSSSAPSTEHKAPSTGSNEDPNHKKTP